MNGRIPIREPNKTQIGSGARGPVTEQIQQAFFAATSGQDSRYRSWLHYVAQQPVAVGL